MNCIEAFAKVDFPCRLNSESLVYRGDHHSETGVDSSLEVAGGGGLVLKAHRLCVSLKSRLESNKEENHSLLWSPSFPVEVPPSRDGTHPSCFDENVAILEIFSTCLALRRAQLIERRGESCLRSRIATSDFLLYTRSEQAFAGLPLTQPPGPA